MCKLIVELRDEREEKRRERERERERENIGGRLLVYKR
jgi:hypothetical protein